MTNGGAMAYVCPRCQEARVSVRGFTDDARTQLVCGLCDHRWEHGDEARAAAREAAPLTLRQAHDEFVAGSRLAPGVEERVGRLKAEFLAARPGADPEAASHWARYQYLFSPEGLPTAPAAELKYFANNSIGAGPGNMSVFNKG